MIRAILFDNLGTKVTALLLAVLLWAYLYLESTENKVYIERKTREGSMDTLEVVLEVRQNVPRGFPFELEYDPQRVHVKLEGPRTALQEIPDVSKVLMVFFVWDHPMGETKPGDQRKLPVMTQWLDKNYEKLLTATPMPEAVERVIQVKVKEPPLPPR